MKYKIMLNAMWDANSEPEWILVDTEDAQAWPSVSEGTLKIQTEDQVYAVVAVGQWKYVRVEE